MSTALEVLNHGALQIVKAPAPVRILPVPWRDPQTVSKTELARHVTSLELACEQNPRSADLRTCLGMAYAMNYEVYKSMDALELAVEMEPCHLFSHLKYAEMHDRQRALIGAEPETPKAVHRAAHTQRLSRAPQ